MVKMVLPSFVVACLWLVKPLGQYDLIRGLGMLLT